MERAIFICRWGKSFMAIINNAILIDEVQL